MDNPYFQPKKLEKKPLPSFVRTKETGDKVYCISGDEYHWVKNPQAYEALGGAFGKETMVEWKDVRAYRQGEPIDVNNAFKYKIAEEKKEEQPPEEKQEFKAHDEPTEVPDSAPKEEPEKGFTSIIIPAYLKNYALFHYTGNCIGSIHEHTNKEKTPYEIILVLNGPPVIKFDNLGQTYADKVIEAPENVGYAKAVNRAIRVSKGEYVVVMNNDVLVFDGWLQNFHKCLNFLDLVMSTPMYGKPWARAREAYELMAAFEGKQIEESFHDFRDFSCIATKKKLFDELGLFDESFFVYKEDLDLLNRMDNAKKRYGATKLVNTCHYIGSTSIGMSDVELKKKEGTEAYNAKYPKV